MSLFTRKPPVDPNSETRDWELVASIASEALREQKKSRRWGVFFKLLTFAYLFVVLAGIVLSQQAGDDAMLSESHTAIIQVSGPIMADKEASAGNIVAGLRRAFKSDKVAAILLVVNSPGGSPVQAGYVYDEINRLRELYQDKKVYAVITDLCASGGYYIAAAADEIYADKASLVGSIGVTAAGFGFVDLMDKVGVERRSFTSGEHKSFLDPFAPLKEDERDFWQSVLKSTHEQFIQVVREGRGERLLESDELFSGLIWNGEQALDLGLIDGLGSPSYVAREIIGEETLRDYTPKPNPLEEFAQNFGISVGMGLGKVLGVDVETPLQLR